VEGHIWGVENATRHGVPRGQRPRACTDTPRESTGRAPVRPPRTVHPMAGLARWGMFSTRSAPISVSPILTADAPRILRVLPSRRVSCPGRGSRCSHPVTPEGGHVSPSRTWSVPHRMVCTTRDCQGSYTSYTPLLHPAGTGPRAIGAPGREGAAHLHEQALSHLHEQALSRGSQVPDRLHRWVEFARRGTVPSRVVANPFKGPPVAAGVASVWRRITVPPRGAGMPARAADD
jgi:hypothetical protein